MPLKFIYFKYQDLHFVLLFRYSGKSVIACYESTCRKMHYYTSKPSPYKLTPSFVPVFFNLKKRLGRRNLKHNIRILKWKKQLFILKYSSQMIKDESITIWNEFSN